MATVWRSFKFFELEVLKGPLSRMEMTSCCYGHKAIFVGDGEGFVYALNRGGTATTLEFSAYKGAVTHMKHLRSRNVLVTIGDDDALNTGIMRVWNLDAVSESAPPYREHRLFNAKHPPPSESIVLRTNYNTELMNSLKFRGRDGDAVNAIPATGVSARLWWTLMCQRIFRTPRWRLSAMRLLCCAATLSTIPP
ncbi:hypothetical protein C4B63_208g25 [Trypanosoma cruzi]|uniref:PEP5/VPS11 N-terminal domain-containing protein n=1 Tax=Trypanosoma cruzi TaxID=5693 RepID=A0A2V2UKT1_TRYCR|nr:hypothetical protein C4B63_208g25 [Trypanosoma cruzi]